jgi:hypothetical protein
MNHRPIRSTLIASSLVVAALASGAAQAALIDRGGGLIYDTDLNVTWLANADVISSVTWTQANSWALNLSYYDSVRNVTYDDWRLPTTLQSDQGCSIQSVPDHGYNCTGSELGHLFYSELGGVADTSITTTHDADYNLFSNVRSNVYWSSSYDASNAWYFHTGLGYQSALSKTTKYGFAWAVRSGDVAAVPEARTYALMLAGVGLIGWRARQRG